LDETLVVVTADHGEAQGELNVYGDHQAADRPTCRVPLVMRHPGLVSGGRVDDAFHYQLDLAPTVLDLAGIDAPASWDAESFAPRLDGDPSGAATQRDHLVIGQIVWSCQRSVRFGKWLHIRTYHDGLKHFPRHMLFDVEADPHQLDNRAKERPEVVQEAASLLTDWHDRMMRTQEHDPPVDPLQTVLHEGGPHHTKGEATGYAERLRETGREEHARAIEENHL
jgi:arylsulfatase A-like enzyme